ncbi:MAG: hypothetical protein AB7O62_22200 [Pirellulales bacterium]
MSSRNSSWQFFVLLVALAVWSLYPVPGVAWLLLAYSIALLAVQLALSWSPLGELSERLSPKQRLAIYLLAAIAPAAWGLRELAASQPWRQWDTVRENMRDRLYLEQTPAISPPLVVSHQPQRFVIHAPGSQTAAVRWTPTSEPRAAIPLGQGVFVLDHDPRQVRDLAAQPAGPFSPALLVDGVPHSRQLNYRLAQPHPRWLSGDANLGIAATVSEETDELILIHSDGSHRRLPVDDGPTDCALLNGGRVSVSHRYSPHLWIIDTESGKTLERVQMPAFQVRMAVSPDGRLLAVACDSHPAGVHFLDTESLQPAGLVSLDFSPDWLEFGRDATEVILTDRRGHAIVRLKSDDSQQPPAPSNWKVSGPPILLPRPVVSMVRPADGRHLLLATTVSLVRPDTSPANHLVENTIHQLDLESWRIGGAFVTDRRGLSQDSPGNTEHGISPMGMAEVEGRLLVCCAGSNEVAELSLADGVALRYLPLDSFPLFAPHGIAGLGEGLWCVASPVDGTLGLFDSDGELRKLIRLAPSDETLAKDDPTSLLVRHGERTFMEGTRAGISCQSCHTDADSDYAQHDIGQGVEPGVLSVRGVAGTSPYLRDGSHGRLRDLHDLAETGYRGYTREVEWDRAQALAEFMNSLPPPWHARQAETTDWDRMAAGMAAMAKARCTHCHAPPAMTNLGQHPVSLLFPDYGRELAADLGVESFVDTPSLRGLATSAPYLHDQRAATLHEVLVRHNRPNRHGNVRALSPDELNDLIYLLERL